MKSPYPLRQNFSKISKSWRTLFEPVRTMYGLVAVSAQAHQVVRFQHSAAVSNVPYMMYQLGRTDDAASLAQFAQRMARPIDNAQPVPVRCVPKLARVAPLPGIRFLDGIALGVISRLVRRAVP